MLGAAAAPPFPPTGVADLRPILALLILAPSVACGPAEAPPPERSEAPATEQAAAPQLSPPGAAELRAAWAEQCTAAEDEIGSALCAPAGALIMDSFTCDFALGDDEYRRYSADLEQAGNRWVLADPDTACEVQREG